MSETTACPSLIHANTQFVNFVLMQGMWDILKYDPRGSLTHV